MATLAEIAETLNECKGHLWYSPVTDMYLTVKYLSEEGMPPNNKNIWALSWVEEPAITTWISFYGDESNRLTTFLYADKDSRYGMLIPFVYKEIRGVSTILVDHILGVKFMDANLSDIGGLYV